MGRTYAIRPHGFHPSTSLPSGLSLPSTLRLGTKCRVEDRMVSLSFDLAQDSELVELPNHKSNRYGSPSLSAVIRNYQFEFPGSRINRYLVYHLDLEIHHIF